MKLLQSPTTYKPGTYGGWKLKIERCLSCKHRFTTHEYVRSNYRTT